MSLLSNEELEERLGAAAKSLLQPPPSLDELLILLDRIEELLSKVAQSPPISLQTSLSPLTKALVSEELMKHSDVDVQVGVAACISEITRITAPDAPYDDDQMKDVFQLIVSTFDNLSDTSSRSYHKRATILETVAKVRSCVIMLDLELDQMITEMFQHFLKSIRVYHGKFIFTSMETIMTLVIEESEYISTELLTPILDALKKNNEEVLPIAKELAEKVICNGADKLRPCLEKTMNTLNASLDDYSEVVASVCQKNTNSFGHSDENILQDQPATEDVKEVIKPRDIDPSEDVKEEITPQENDALNGSPKSIACNSNNENGDEETVTAENYSNQAKFKQQSDAKSTSEAESDDIGAQKPAHLKAKVEHVANGEARPSNSRNNSAESSDPVDDKKQAEQVPSHQEIPSEEIHTTPDESPPIEADRPSDAVKDVTVHPSPVKEVRAEDVKLASPVERGLPDENQVNQPKSSGRTKRKDNMANEDTAYKKASGGINIAAVNKKQRTKKKQHGVTTNRDKTLNEGVSKNDGGTMSGSEARSQDQEKLVDVSNKKVDGSLRKEDGKGGRVKPKSEKDTSKYSVTEDTEKDKEASSVSTKKSAQDEVSQQETPRTGSKRKQAPGTDNKPQTMQYGKNLVGSKVKVWWPDDEAFYEGTIASFNPVNRKHKVSYDDGDTEILNLRKELWEFVGDDSALDGGRSAELPGQDALSNKKQRKGPAKSETSNKREKEDPPKRKPKGNATKSGSKSKDDSKAEPESAENSDNETDKSENHSKEVEGESPDPSTKASGKSRDIGVAKTSNKKNQDTPLSTSSKGKTPQSKGKTPQTGKTTSPVGKGMKKSSSSKVKTTKDSVKSSDTVKGGKSGGSGNKSGKRRRK